MHVVGRETKAFPAQGDRLLGFVLLKEQNPQIAVGLDVVRLDVDRLRVVFDGPVQPAFSSVNLLSSEARPEYS